MASLNDQGFVDQGAKNNAMTKIVCVALLFPLVLASFWDQPTGRQPSRNILQPAGSKRNLDQMAEAAPQPQAPVGRGMPFDASHGPLFMPFVPPAMPYLQYPNPALGMPFVPPVTSFTNPALGMPFPYVSIPFNTQLPPTMPSVPLMPMTMPQPQTRRPEVEPDQFAQMLQASERQFDAETAATSFAQRPMGQVWRHVLEDERRGQAANRPVQPGNVIKGPAIVPPRHVPQVQEQVPLPREVPPITNYDELANILFFSPPRPANQPPPASPDFQIDNARNAQHFPQQTRDRHPKSVASHPALDDHAIVIDDDEDQEETEPSLVGEEDYGQVFPSSSAKRLRPNQQAISSEALASAHDIIFGEGRQVMQHVRETYPEPQATQIITDYIRQRVSDPGHVQHLLNPSESDNDESWDTKANDEDDLEEHGDDQTIAQAQEPAVTFSHDLPSRPLNQCLDLRIFDDDSGPMDRWDEERGDDGGVLRGFVKCIRNLLFSSDKRLRDVFEVRSRIDPIYFHNAIHLYYALVNLQDGSTGFEHVYLHKKMRTVEGSNKAPNKWARIKRATNEMRRIMKERLPIEQQPKIDEAPQLVVVELFGALLRHIAEEVWQQGKWQQLRFTIVEVPQHH